MIASLTGARAWAAAVHALPARGRLPARTVLVPSERHAHALRRELARSGHGADLAGTRLVSPLTAAVEALRRGGVAFTTGEEALRPARLLALFREGLPLEHFDLELLRSRPGWGEAFAGAVATLEAAGLTPSSLPREPAQARDLALVWARLDAAAGPSLSAARVLREAAALLARDPRAWPHDGPALAAVTGHESTALASFLRAVPGLTLAVWTSAPLRARDLARMEALFGPEAARALREEPAPPPSPATERDLLAAYLFRPPEVLSAPERPRSAGPDGTVHLEEHAGVEEELEATVAWVARAVLEERLPLEEIAVLLPVPDPLAGLVAERLARLPFEGGTLPVHVAGGLPATSLAAGARLLATVRALRAHLSAETLALVLPALRLEGDGERGHLTHGEAMELAFALGTLGGNAARPEGALEWSARAAARVGELEAALARAGRNEDSAAREAWRLERTLRSLRAVRPALDALVEVARGVLSGAPLSATWERLRGFLARWLLLPGEGAALPARLAESLAPACLGGLGASAAGDDALALVEDHLRALRVGQRRFGEPAVYVGTVAGAAGLDFAAVRVIGLCEGSLPSPPREDPVLPGSLAAAVERANPGCVLPTAEDRVSAQLAGLVAAVRGARRSVALSAPRQDLARTEREPAAVFIEAAAALGRPDASTGEAAPAVPGMKALRRDAFGPARESAARFRAARPVGEGAWLDRVARGAPELPPSWSGEPALSLERLDELRSASGPLGRADGVLGAGGPFPPVPGLDAARPISASALKELVACPRWFLMRRILHWDEPAGPPPLRELDPASYGTLLHRAVEALHRAHGPALAARQGSLASWRRTALELGDRLFDELLSAYPLVGEGVRAKERERLRESLDAFLEYDWSAGGERRFVGVELPFGEERPLEVDAGGTRLFLRGYIDRVDVVDGATLVRDLKSGKAHPRAGAEQGPAPVLDIQLGLYQLAARELAGAWGTPRRVIAAYAYASGRGEVEERGFRDDAAALEKATEGWLAAAAQLLAARAFAPTPLEGDCTYCPFRPLCGSGAPARAAEGLEEAGDGPLARFRALKLGDEEDGA